MSRLEQICQTFEHVRDAAVCWVQKRVHERVREDEEGPNQVGTSTLPQGLKKS